VKKTAKVAYDGLFFAYRAVRTLDESARQAVRSLDILQAKHFLVRRHRRLPVSLQIQNLTGSEMCERAFSLWRAF